MTVETSQKCPCVHIWVNSYNRQLTDFGYCSYLLLTFSYRSIVLLSCMSSVPRRRDLSRVTHFAKQAGDLGPIS